MCDNNLQLINYSYRYVLVWTNELLINQYQRQLARRRLRANDVLQISLQQMNMRWRFTTSSLAPSGAASMRPQPIFATERSRCRQTSVNCGTLHSDRRANDALSWRSSEEALRSSGLETQGRDPQEQDIPDTHGHPRHPASGQELLMSQFIKSCTGWEELREVGDRCHHDNSNMTG